MDPLRSQFNTNFQGHESGERKVDLLKLTSRDLTWTDGHGDNPPGWRIRQVLRNRLTYMIPDIETTMALNRMRRSVLGALLSE